MEIPAPAAAAPVSASQRPARARPAGPHRARPQTLFRKLRADEYALHAAHLRRLSEHDRAMRFMGCVPDAHLADYCARPAPAGRSVLGFFDGAILRGVAEVVYEARPSWRGGCELALSVETAWQGRGVGTALMHRAIEIARNRGASPVRVLFLRENRRMRALALKLGMQLTTRDSEIAASLRPPWPNQFSLLAEGMGDGHAWWSHWLAAAPLRNGVT
ncbi:MAG: GNAT family N-acetyltransferase [Gammaproteobacteria bacterium]